MTKEGDYSFDIWYGVLDSTFCTFNNYDTPCAEMMEDNSNLNVFRVPGEEIQWRIKRVQHEMRTRNMDALFVVQRIDVLYFSGTAQNASVFIPAEGEPLLLVKKFLPRALEESPLNNIFGVQSFRDIPGIIINHQEKLPPRLGFEWDVMPMREFQFYKKLFADAECVDGSPAIHAVRSIKSKWELAQMEIAAEKSLQLFDYITEHMKPGDMDIEISTRAESFARSIGHGAALRIRDYQKSGFPLSLLAKSRMGTNWVLALPSVREGNCLDIEPKGRLNRGEPITLESRFFVNGYHIQESGISSIGPLDRSMNDLVELVLHLQGETLAEVKAGIPADLLFHLALEKARVLGLDRNAPGRGMAGKKILGNGIGLELVEPPIITEGNQQILKQGMVLTLFSETHVRDQYSLRSRDVVLVTENGHRKITRLPPKVLVMSPHEKA